LARLAFLAGFFAFLAAFLRAFGLAAFFFFAFLAFLALRFAGAFLGFGGANSSSVIGLYIIGAGTGAAGGSGGNIGSIIPGPPNPVTSLFASIYVSSAGCLQGGPIAYPGNFPTQVSACAYCSVVLVSFPRCWARKSVPYPPPWPPERRSRCRGGGSTST
jgi:hypothetical protein